MSKPRGGRRNEMKWPEFPREWTDDKWPESLTGGGTST